MTKEITLTTGEVALVDDEDFERLSGYPWRLQVTDQCRYAVFTRRIDGVKIAFLMHRMILGAKRGEIVDHIEWDGLDNRRANLRKVTRSQNMQNRRGASKHSKTGIRGVRSDPRRNRYIAQVDVEGKRYRTYHKTLEGAAVAAVQMRANLMTHSVECTRKGA